MCNILLVTGSNYFVQFFKGNKLGSIAIFLSVAFSSVDKACISKDVIYITWFHTWKDVVDKTSFTDFETT